MALGRRVEARELLEPAGDCVLLCDRDRRDLVDDAFDAGANDDAVGLRRDVDVGGAQRERPAERVVQLQLLGRADLEDGRCVVLDLDGRERLLVHACERLLDVSGLRDAEADGYVERESDLLRLERVRGISDGDEQRLVGEPLDGKRAEAAREAFGQSLRHLVVELAAELEERQLVLLRERAGDLRGRGVAALDEDLAETLVRHPLLGERGVELLVGHVPVADEERPERRPVRCGLRCSGRLDLGGGVRRGRLDGLLWRLLRRDDAVNVVDRRGDRLRGRDDETERDPELEPEPVGLEDVRGVGETDKERPLGQEAKREDRALARDVLRKEPRGLRVDLGGRDLGEVQVVLLREPAAHVLRRDAAARDEDLAEPRSRRALLVERGLELVLGHQGVAQEQRAEERHLRLVLVREVVEEVVARGRRVGLGCELKRYG